jgi:hypothetical protein
MNKKVLNRDFVKLLVATVLFGSSSGIFLAVFNNYLSEVHGLDALSRGWLEFPRELPGFLIMFVSMGMLAFLRETRIASLAMVLSGLGALGLGFLAEETVVLVIFVFLWSLGDHIIFAVEGPLGLKLAREGAEGRRLGQLGGGRNLGVILGVGAVFCIAWMVGDYFNIFFAIAATSALGAGYFYFRMSVDDGPQSKRFVLKRKYALFYGISALFGVRKQIFIAFGTWVLVRIHHVPVATIALLYFISAVIGVGIRPLLGDVIDWLGERVVLAADEVLLIAICGAYAFAGDLFAPNLAVWVLYGAYILDAVLFALRIARTTYLKKIADDPSEITPTISVGITVDHMVAMSLPILSGYIWDAFGFRYVFILAGAIAVAGFFLCLRIQVPRVVTAVSKPVMN